MTRTLALLLALIALAAPAAAFDFSRQNDLVAKDTTLRALDVAGPFRMGSVPDGQSTAHTGRPSGLTGHNPPNAILAAPGNRISFCPALSCIVGGDHQRASLLVSSQTLTDAAAEEQTVAILTEINKGRVREWAPSTAYVLGDNIAVTAANAVYRVVQAGTSGSSAPSGNGAGIINGSLRLDWINDAAIASKVGLYNETVLMPGGGNSWAQANNLEMRPGFLPNFVVNTELDLTNNSGQDCGIGVNCLGLYLGFGGGNRVTTGISLSRQRTDTWGMLWGIRLDGGRLAERSAISIDAGANYGLSANDSGFVTGQQFGTAFIHDNSISPIGIQIAGQKSSAQITGRQFYVDPAGRGYFEGVTVRAGNASCVHTAGTSTETVSCSSDVRLKTDIADAPSAFDVLGPLRVRTFTETATGRRQTGVVAQEVRETHPDLVHEGSDGMLTVDQPNPWLLVQAVQELRAATDRLRLGLGALAMLNAALFAALFARRAAA